MIETEILDINPPVVVTWHDVDDKVRLEVATVLLTAQKMGIIHATMRRIDAYAGGVRLEMHCGCVQRFRRQGPNRWLIGTIDPRGKAWVEEKISETAPDVGGRRDEALVPWRAN